MDLNLQIWIVAVLLQTIVTTNANTYSSSSVNGTDSSLSEGTADDQMTDNPCLLSSYTRINISYQADTVDPAKMCQRLPTDQWMTVIDADNRALEIMQIMHSSMEYCMQPEYCGSRLPWYIHTETELRSNQIQFATLCTTDTTSRGTISCCQSAKPIQVAMCSDKVMYRMTKPIKREACGTICTATKEENNGGDTLAGRLVGYDGFPAPQWYHRLTHDEKSNLVTVKFQIEYRKKPFYNEIEIQKALEREIVQKWNLEHLLRKRRSSRYRGVVKLREQNIHHLKGTPVTKNHLSYFSFYIEDDKGNIIPGDALMDTLSDTILHTDVTSEGVCHVSAISRGKSIEIPDLPAHTLLNMTTTSMTHLTTLRRDRNQSANTGDTTLSWIAIVGIVAGVAAAIILFVVVILIYYKCCGGTKYMYTVQQRHIAYNKTDGEVSRVTLRWSTGVEEMAKPSPELNNNKTDHQNYKSQDFSGG